jgi:hypothetical protein
MVDSSMSEIESRRLSEKADPNVLSTSQQNLVDKWWANPVMGS